AALIDSKSSTYKWLSAFSGKNVDAHGERENGFTRKKKVAS
ncbi:hypothetical protein AVEN_236869-1, partial [Araneus ventricosus]